MSKEEEAILSDLFVKANDTIERQDQKIKALEETFNMILEENVKLKEEKANVWEFFDKATLEKTKKISSLESDVARLKKEKQVVDEKLKLHRTIDKKDIKKYLAEERQKEEYQLLKSENEKLKEEKALIIDKYVGLDFANEQLREEIERLKSSGDSEGVRELLINYGNWLIPEAYTEDIEMEVDKYLRQNILPKVEEKKEEYGRRTCIHCSDWTERFGLCENCAQEINFKD
jgi:hypothetical protein